MRDTKISSSWSRSFLTRDPLSQNTALIFLLSTLWALLSSAWVGLSDQEAYYWTWSQHFDLGYFEHPPLQAWITRALTYLFGNEPWVVRLPAFFIGRLIGFYYFFLWCHDRFGKMAALWGVQFLCSCFFILAGSIITLPDAFLFPCFCAALYYSEQKNIWKTSLAMGLAIFSKWTAILFVPGVILAFYDRKYPARSLKKIGLIALGAALLQIPVLMWNIQNDWSSVKFHLHDRHVNYDASWLKAMQNTISFSASQLGMGGIPFLILTILFFRKKFRKPVIKTLSHHMPLLAWILPAFLVVGFSAMRGELRFYWTAPALIVVLPWMLSKIELGHQQALLQKLSFFSLLSSIALMSSLLYLPVGEYLRPIVESYRKYDMRFSPRGDLEGWRQLANKIQAEGLLTDPDFFVGGSDFRLSAQLAWGFKIPNMHRVLVGSPIKSQYGFWSKKDALNTLSHQAIFAGDNRYIGIHPFGKMCQHRLKWETFEYVLGKYPIKEIKWSICNILKSDLR